MGDVEFQVNLFRTYKTVVEGISLGFIDGTSGAYSPKPEETLKYDGVTVVLEDGRRFPNTPQLRSAILKGWFVEVEAVGQPYRPLPAGVRVRDPETRIGGAPVMSDVPVVQDETRTVGDVEARRRQREESLQRRYHGADVSREPSRTVASAVSVSPPVPEYPDEVNEILALMRSAEAEYWAERSRPKDAVLHAWETELVNFLDAVEEAGSQPTSKGAPRDLRDRPRREASAVASPRSFQAQLLREDPTDNGGRVVASVQRPLQRDIERDSEREFPLDVAPARPAQPEQPRRRPFLGAGVLVNEERHVGTIALSQPTRPVDAGVKAQVSAADMASVRIAKQAQVGGFTGEVIRDELQDGVAVGRLRSPTVQNFKLSPTGSVSGAAADAGKVTRMEPVKRPIVPPAEVHVTDDYSDVLPDVVTGPKAVPRVYLPPDQDPAFAQVREVLPDFTWNRERPVTERVAEALTYRGDSLRLWAIMAVETPSCKEALGRALSKP